jgi:hypothetical protein
MNFLDLFVNKIRSSNDDPLVVGLVEYLEQEGFVPAIARMGLNRIIGDIIVPLDDDWTAYVTYENENLVINFRSEIEDKQVWKAPLADPKCLEMMRDRLLGQCILKRENFNPHVRQQRTYE